MTESRNLVAAKIYASRGWKVFPIQPRSKVPLTAHGFKDATCDIPTIEQMWAQHPDAGVGIATGLESGILVWDIDPRNKGDQTLLVLEARYGALPRTVEAITGGGGRHLIFKHPGNAVIPSGKAWEGIDIKGDGGYIVAPYSVHPNGTPYMWRSGQGPGEIEEAEVPAWGLEQIERAKAKRVEAHQAARTPTDLIYPESTRNESLTRRAGQMQRTGMSFDAILAALLAENTVRCVPPLPEAEVLRIAQSVSRYEPDATQTIGVSQGIVGRVLQFTDLAAISKDEPPISWILDRRIARGDCCILAGPPGVGKSFIAYEMAIAGSNGLPILGAFEPEEPIRVMVIDEENPQDEIERRIRRLCAAWSVPYANPNLRISRTRQGFSFRDASFERALIQAVRDFEPDLVVMDSLIAISTIRDEGDAVDVRRFFNEHCYPVISVCNSALMFLHHTNKAIYLKEKPMASAGFVRGSIDIVGAPDSAHLVQRVAEGKPLIRFESLKVRRGAEPEALILEIVDGVEGGSRPMLRHAVPVDGRTAEQAAVEAASCRDAVLDVLGTANGPMARDAIHDWVRAIFPDVSLRSLQVCLAELRQEGRVDVEQDAKDLRKFRYQLKVSGV